MLIIYHIDAIPLIPELLVRVYMMIRLEWIIPKLFILKVFFLLNYCLSIFPFGMRLHKRNQIVVHHAVWISVSCQPHWVGELDNEVFELYKFLAFLHHDRVVRNSCISASVFDLFLVWVLNRRRRYTVIRLTIRRGSNCICKAVLITDFIIIKVLRSLSICNFRTILVPCVNWIISNPDLLGGYYLVSLSFII